MCCELYSWFCQRVVSGQGVQKLNSMQVAIYKCLQRQFSLRRFGIDIFSFKSINWKKGLFPTKCHHVAVFVCCIFSLEHNGLVSFSSHTSWRMNVSTKLAGQQPPPPYHYYCAIVDTNPFLCSRFCIKKQSTAIIHGCSCLDIMCCSILLFYGINNKLFRENGTFVVLAKHPKISNITHEAHFDNLAVF